MLIDAITSGNPRRRREALDRFSSEHRDDGFVIVTPLLSSPDASRRIAAIEALAGNTTESAVSWLVEHAESDPSAEVRVECLRQLDDIPSKNCRDLFLRKATDTDRRVRQFVASGLRHYADDDVTRALARLVFDDDVYVQERAIESLAALPRNGASYLLHLLIPLWEGTYWDSIIRDRANEEGERCLVEYTTASFRQSLQDQARPPTEALRWMSLVDPETVLLYAEDRERESANETQLDSIRALSELIHASEQLGRSCEPIRGRCVALLRVIAEREPPSNASEKARILLERFSA